ncbi:MAG: D-alanyl-D-alanine carboxypeptidase/D-alanyl-D-alanine-endopeptidase [Bacteroidales bacterium]|jgi:D-alanyl-D-alanine carboxypeptidase/D-alanyl-D-alanine-endopeptidase (penicillin-binding protein 4)|nr:D-alanyl-D-alanine carboxypeptidase/D-alanyl-D-alanine-endopeptidase [Bacteroidales bacterium]
MRYIISILVIFCSTTLGAQTAVQTFLAHPALKHATVGFELRELTTGKTIAAHNAQTACTPASVTKLITTATAMEILGSEYTFKTKLAISGNIDSVGILHGNVYIIGGGDPTLDSRYFPHNNVLPAWIAAIRSAGIVGIEGSVIAETSLYDTNPLPLMWLREDAGNYYGAGVFALSWADNTIGVTIENGKITAQSPNFGTVRNELQSGTKDSIYFYGEPFSAERSMYGTFRPGTTRTEKMDMGNPPEFLRQYFTAQLQANGISVVGNQIAKSSKRVIYTTLSPPLKEIVKQTNFVSNNNFAEHLLKHLALQTDSIATLNAALHVQRTLWTKRGVDMSGVSLYDGSGLSPKNAMPAAFVCDILVKMKNNTSFRNSLPVAGESGTVAKFLATTPLKGKVRAKSGSFRAVQCYAGYISQGGKEYAFCILVNNFTGARPVLVQQIEQLLVQELGANF